MKDTITKTAVIMFWCVFAYTFFQPFDGIGQTIIYWAGIVMAVAHLIEYVLKRKFLEQVGEGGINGFIQTMLFGYIYWLPLQKKHNLKSSG